MSYPFQRPRVTIDTTFGCHLWAGELDRDGYGRIGRKLAHRVAYEEAHGPIPAGMEVEHLCRRRNCVRLEHLELLTRSQQELAKSWRRRARQERCKNGHDLGLYGMITEQGGRLCRKCQR